MDELSIARMRKQEQAIEPIVNDLCASIPQWLVKRLSREMQDAVFHLAVIEAKERLTQR